MRANRKSEGKAAKAGRLPDGKFKKGQSGNPGGVPKATWAVKQICLDRAPEAVKELFDLLKHPDPRVRLAAIEIILDRALGKPPVGNTDPEDGQVTTIRFVHTEAPKVV